MEDSRLKYFSIEEITKRDKLLPVLIRNGLLNQANRFRDCGNKFNAFRCQDVDEHKEHQKHAILFAYYCEQRICDRCCQKRGFVIQQEIIELLKQNRKSKSHKFAFLTLTKNMSRVPYLTPSVVKTFNKQVRKLLNELYPKARGCGGIAVLEFGKNLNMHCHILVYGAYYPQSYLSKKWREITGDSFIVDIRAITDVKKASYYLTKYLSKSPRFVNPESYAHYLNALKGVRRLHRYGIFYGYRVPQPDTIKCPYCGGGLRYLGICGPSIQFNGKEYSEILDDLKMENCAS